MEKGVYLITGFPGFLSLNIVAELLKQDKASKVYLLHLGSMKKQAEEGVRKLKTASEGELILVEGDITRPGLDMEKEKIIEIQEEVDYVWHLAAIYDLAVPRDLAQRVNVEGTRQVNDFCQTLRHLKRYVYFSTAFIAGAREGELMEDELIRPERFHNFYEETKFDAEVLVDDLKDRLPITIIRPGIVKGNSDTGETVKFDGPYFLMNMFKRLSFLPWIPFLGEGTSYINIVPVEYVVRAAIYLGHDEVGHGKTYHLTDPAPLTVKEVYGKILWQMLRKKPKGSIPLSLSNWALGFRFVRRYLRVEREALDYFTLQGKFDCQQARGDLEGASIHCPSLSSQIDKMVEFYLENSSNERLHVKID
ncbi:3-beta hydroxysteroid dehydrogenase [Bacillus sp. AFS015802]|uniref:SDR family oxidoreductase n=1 Tax=Bacillus sp. AFS015802 TaxID=2033486 RepID=UPI000BF9C8AE|nr:SDR family oxidoreductase [Bacillus sp. AFS015802]PFA66333.1 3-beta hydroxysteroid dehydrogenase [Bacillus sp. AFS015802]